MLDLTISLDLIYLDNTYMEFREIRTDYVPPHTRRDALYTIAKK